MIKTQDARGLTVAEILIAASVLVVALLGMAGMFPSAYRAVLYGGQMTKATALAQAMMELVRSGPIAYVPRYHGVDTDDSSTFPSDDLGLSPPFRGGTHVRRWRSDIALALDQGKGLPSGVGTISVVDHETGLAIGGSPPLTLLMRVTVTVSWTETTGRKTVSFMSLKHAVP
jgi:hypothetical protein